MSPESRTEPGERLEFEFFLFNKSSLDNFCEEVIGAIPSDQFGRVLSYRAVDFQKVSDDPEVGEKLVVTREALSQVSGAPSELAIVWVDGPGTYANRSLHVEVILPVWEGLQADIYKFDHQLPDGFDPCTERYRDRSGTLPAYLINFSSKEGNKKPKLIALYPDGSMRRWKFKPKKSTWISTT